MPRTPKYKPPKVPLDQRKVPGEALDPLCSAIGHIVINWSHIETALNAWLAIIYHSPEGKQLASELPHEMKRKLRFLRKAFRDIDRLQAYAAEALEHLRAVRRLSNVRHFLIHGSPTHYDAVDNGFIFVRVDRDDAKTMHQLKELRITAVKLLDHSRECLTLSSAMLDMAKRLLEPLIGKKRGH